jgi:hypothetical protein
MGEVTGATVRSSSAYHCKQEDKKKIKRKENIT